MALTSHSLFIFPLLVCLTYYLEISIVILCGEGKRSEKLTPFTSINLLHGWKVFIHYPHRCIIIRPTKLYFSIWEFFYLIKHSKCYWKFYQQLLSSSNGFAFFIKSPHPPPFLFLPLSFSLEPAILFNLLYWNTEIKYDSKMLKLIVPEKSGHWN